MAVREELALARTLEVARRAGVWSALMEAEAIVARARDIGMNLVA